MTQSNPHNAPVSNGQPRVLVVGSIHMDMACRVDRPPQPGETVLGRSFQTSPGGKGANQAVAAARLGAQVRMIGRVGADEFGQRLLDHLAHEDIQTSDVLLTEHASSGVAMILVDHQGENCIVVHSGANALLTPDDVYCHADAFAWANVVMLQLELPLPTVRAAMDMARRNGVRVVLDPAPVPDDFPDALYHVDLLTPNVVEAERLTDTRAAEERVDKLVAMHLIERGARNAVLKLGSRGALAVTDDGHFYTVPAYKVQVVDSTGAGDAFTAALAVATARGQRIHQAVYYASAAGALACTEMGAQAAMPSDSEVRFLMDDQQQA
jgi:ribokinase